MPANLPLRPLPLKVVHHTPCHMEKMGWSLYTLSFCAKSRAYNWSAGFAVLRYRRHLRL